MLVVIGEQHRVDNGDIVNGTHLVARLDIIPHLKRLEQQNQQPTDKVGKRPLQRQTDGDAAGRQQRHKRGRRDAHDHSRRDKQQHIQYHAGSADRKRPYTLINFLQPVRRVHPLFQPAHKLQPDDQQCNRRHDTKPHCGHQLRQLVKNRLPCHIIRSLCGTK